MISTNACSILHKIDELRSFVSQKLPDVISLTESWLHPDISDAELHLDDYILFRNDRLGHPGGGVLMYAAKYLNPVVRPLPPDQSSSFYHDALLNDLNLSSEPLPIVTIYQRRCGSRRKACFYSGACHCAAARMSYSR